MVSVVSRRQVLKGLSAALSLGSIVHSGTGLAGPKASERALTILYPIGPDSRFNADYYRDHHLTLFMDIYGSSIERFELCTVQSSAPLPGDVASTNAMRFAALMNIWISDFGLFTSRSTDAAYTAMGADKANFTNIQSTVQVDEVQAMLGEPRSAPRVGDECIQFCFPNKPGARWDVGTYSQVDAPRFLKAFGPEAVSRIEIRKGISELDAGAPGYLGSVSIYVKDRKAFATAYATHGGPLEARTLAMSNVHPFLLRTSVYGIGTSRAHA
ncbi:MAG TPA: hypothetical protein VN692_07640 [Steroidobacteraceae bacterium]|nr:hypothetical protein [Steroidobacteraceae bacterium]